MLNFFVNVTLNMYIIFYENCRCSDFASAVTKVDISDLNYNSYFAILFLETFLLTMILLFERVFAYSNFPVQYTVRFCDNCYELSMSVYQETLRQLNKMWHRWCISWFMRIPSAVPLEGNIRFTREGEGNFWNKIKIRLKNYTEF